MAFLVLILAVLSRLVPHWLHLTGANVTLLGAGMLFFGSRLKTEQRWMTLVAIAAIALSDWYLTTVVYGYPFHALGYLPAWIWYGAVALAASATLQKRHGALRVGVTAVASSTGFFLLSNGLVWWKGNMYPHDGAGLLQSYTAGLPFYRNDLASTLIFSAVFFALPAAAASLTQAARNAAGHGASAA